MEHTIDTQILDIVQSVRREADSANASYERAVDRIERRASSTTIYLSQMSTAMDIVADSKQAMDALYTTYEALVRTLDMQCRPLAEQGASAHAVYEVYKLIAYMNSESSSLRGNFTASLNSYSLGDVAGVRYTASLEAQTIERFWKTKYSMMPEAVEEEKRKRAAAQQAAKRREEQRKKEAEEKAERERQAAEEAARRQEAALQAQAQKESVTYACMAQVLAFEKAVWDEAHRQKLAIRQEVKAKLASLQEEKKQHETTLAGLGFMKFNEKKQEKQEIERLNNRILTYMDPELQAKAAQELDAQAEAAIEKYKKEVMNYLDSRFSKTAGKGVTAPCPAAPDVASVFK